jgi:hypothetical protein
MLLSKSPLQLIFCIQHQATLHIQPADHMLEKQSAHALPYLLPLMLETEPPALRSIYRNALILAFSLPVYTFFLLIQLLLLAVLVRYLFFLFFLFVPAVAVLMGNLGVRYLIENTVQVARSE